MRKLTRLKLLIIPVAVCLLLFAAFGGTAFARTIPGTRPHVSGTKYVTSDIDNCAIVTIHGSGFLPSTVTVTNYAQVFVLAWSPGLGLIDPGPYNGFSTPVDVHGSYTAYFPICYLDAPNEWIQIASQDLTTSFLSNIMMTIANGTAVPQLPHISAPNLVHESGGCANVKIKGSGFIPSTNPTYPNIEQVTVFASTAGGTYSTISPAVDTQGSFSAILPVCGITQASDLLEIAADDGVSYLYANVIYTSTN